MRRLLTALLITAAALSILLLSLVIVGVSRQDFIAPLWTPVGFVGVLTFLVATAVGIGMLAMANLLALAIWPARVQRNLTLLQAFPLRCLLVGMLALVTQVWLVGGTLAGVHGLLFITFVGWDLIALAQGLPAVAELAGERLGVLHGPRAAAIGTAVLACGGTVPVLGWALSAGVILQALGVHFVPTEKGVAL